MKGDEECPIGSRQEPYSGTFLPNRGHGSRGSLSQETIQYLLPYFINPFYRRLVVVAISVLDVDFLFQFSFIVYILHSIFQFSGFLLSVFTLSPSLAIWHNEEPGVVAGN